MALLFLIFLRVLFLLNTEGGLVYESISSNISNISIGSSLTPQTNPSWLSPSGIFAFGFYQLQDNGFAVGIWLTTKPEITVVWTANRDDPPLSSSSTIELTEKGLLLLHTTDGEKKLTSQMDLVTSASMFDSGNFVLYSDSRVVWESFKYPCDTILGGQKLVSPNQLVSSVSASQHSSGRFILVMQYDGNLVAYPQDSSMYDTDSYWSTGTFGTYMKPLILNTSGSLYMGESDEAQVLYQPTSSRSRKNETIIFRATLNPDGNFVLYSHIFTTPSSNLTWKMEWEALKGPCEAKGICGVNSYCSISADNVAGCHCFPGFLFINNSTNGKFLGCYRNFTDDESCSRRGLKLSYKITALKNMEVAVYPYSVMNLSKRACGKSCLDDCNCWVGMYANGRCNKLKFPIIYGVYLKSKLSTVFIKTSFLTYTAKPQQRSVPASMNLKQSVLVERKKLVSILAITLGSLAFMCTIMALSSFFFSECMLIATDGFKELIGRNSYGEVFKGFISDGQKAVAVKRLHRMFKGDEGFRAEITAIAQTHHRNLVRLLGFCIHGARKLLVYEFMSNGSLADLLYNSETPPAWKERVRVALDVARGILYLHEECETRIIHCNVQPQNILFDESGTAKISDFGLSKLLRPNQSGTLTDVRGTRGYLAPEWYKNTSISTKVDIYSFGVVLLEILCCRGEMEIDILSEDKIPLAIWVYKCFVSSEVFKLIGEDEVDIDMFEKMVKVGLLCIQDDPDARPSIKDVILMLEGTTDIPIPPSPTPPFLL